MDILPVYILKLSICFAAVFLFYYCILRRLTFYNYNRWYLIGYTVLCFIIPFIDVTALLHNNNWQERTIINWVPVIGNETVNRLPVHTVEGWNIWQWTLAIVAAGMVVMLCRLALQLFSFKRMLRKAERVSNDGMKLYQVNDNIMPFSFGNAIFINRHLHDEQELQEIIRHEFVHVKQKHSFDIMWAELLCILNWYNPFVWLLKRSIRQNLEFIADNKVLENGINKKEYQYLLLKVIGNNQYSIANQFNFSSLKKRIAMMNKTKSAKRQLIRLLFLLPATAILLLAFRTKWNREVHAVAATGKKVNEKIIQPLGNEYVATSLPAMSNTRPGLYDETAQRDTTIKKRRPNSKGFFVNLANVNGEDVIVVKDKNGKDVKTIPAKEWDANEEKYEALYGSAAVPPIPPTPPAPPAIVETVVTTPAVVEVTSPAVVNVAPAAITKLNVTSSVNEVIEVPVKATVSVKPATLSQVKVTTPVKATVSVSPQAVVEVPTTVSPAIVEVRAPATPYTPATMAKLPDNVKKLQIDNNKVTLWLKNGKKEKFDLNNAEEKKNLEKNYGIYAPAKPSAPEEVIEVPAREN